MTTERSIIARSNEPLVAIFIEEDGQAMVRYFIDDQLSTSPHPSADVQAALAAIGSCSDLNWDSWAGELDRIRHESPPTPPLDDL